MAQAESTMFSLTVAAGGEPSSSASSPGDMEDFNEDMKKSSSRFQVARVDSKTDRRDSGDNSISGSGDAGESRKYSVPDSPGVAFSISTDSVTQSYETTTRNYMLNTIEALPCVDNYRNIFSATGQGMKSRPTLAELHEEMEDGEIRGKHKEPLLAAEERTSEEVVVTMPDKPPASSIKFGWIKGVLVRCLLNIWGVMLFIRLSWVTGNAGVGLTSVIVLLSTLVTTLTALSMSAICTNGEVKGGGAYYLISRSLGPEFGGAIGLVFSVANAVAVAMYVVGFAETVRDLMKTHGAQMVDDTNDIRIIGSATMFLLLAIAIIGMEWEARTQLVLLVILLIALVNFLIGTFIPPTPKTFSRGFTGYKGETFAENFFPKFQQGEDFFSVFAIFFPAATGILAGANISGDLKDAQYAIPKGTLLAILITSSVYVAVAWLAGATILREANGLIPGVVSAASNISGLPSVFDAVTNTSTAATSTFAVDPSTTAASNVLTAESVGNCSLVKDGCTYGLLHDFQVMEMISGFGPLITAGIFSATLSSALASLVSAPKAVCKDRIFPYIHVFAKGYGPSDNPRRAYLLAFAIGMGFTLIGDLNAIAPVISNFFLMSYALINYSCFDASLANSPGWRPAFGYYNMWLSLLGALVCLAVMFIINWWTALITFSVISALFVYVHYSKPNVNWGSSTQAHVYRNALQFTLKLLHTEDHIKNFRPQVLVLSGSPDNRPALVDFVNHITKKVGLMICGNVITGQQSDNLRQLNSNAPYDYFTKHHIKAFYSATSADTFQHGVQSLLQNVGLGKMRPNTLVMGFKSNWTEDEPERVLEYFNIIHDAFDMNCGVGILRLKEGFGMGLDGDGTVQNGNSDDEASDDEHASEHNGSPVSAESAKMSVELNKQKKHMKVEVEKSSNGPQKINTEVIKSMNKFRNRKEKGTIDVWWLFDDGGLTLLIPYLLTNKAHWRGCRMRIFTPGTRKGELDREQRQLATLLTKFRIEVKDMQVLPEVNKPPKEESVHIFNSYLAPWLLDEQKGETQEEFPWKTTEEEMEILHEKTTRHIRLKELLIEKSSEASLIVMTLPMPRKGTCSAGLYMTWIDFLTRDLPPILLLRGNQTSVLTFYS
ncbi:hypothetical protein C0Q70_19796 [Pomacea canaliculata]|uniref:Uncharacterized protein n=1 Tax=Pomacea canaliculata TaxID=400727 RepID=A0A2T7NDS0_POMCA|nr:hypothetical protein C0Q70_19796 [Pomacea canaliculata]